MARVLVITLLIASILALAKEQQVLDRSGLLGSCTAVAGAPAAPNGGQWLACRPGQLTGYPDLSNDSCERGGMRDDVRYWICPTQLVGGRSSDETPTG